jgi:hypothetical protein
VRLAHYIAHQGGLLQSRRAKGKPSMKHLLLLVCIAALVGFTSFTHAAKKPKGDSAMGLQGTIATVGDNGFTITDKDDKTINIQCDKNTKFMQDGQPVKPDVIKVGVKVGIIGALDGTRIDATTVNIASSDDKKKKS